MALVKTLNPAGGLVEVNGKTLDNPQVIEDIVDDVAALTAAAADITSVVAGAGMTGGGTTGAVTLNVIAGANINVTADAVALADNVDVAGTLDVTGVATFDGALNHDGTTAGFMGAAPVVAQPIGAVAAATPIGAALILLGLCTASEP